MDDRLQDFLRLVMRQEWRNPPSVWNEQLRVSLSDRFVTVGFGGVLKITEAGRAALDQH